MAFKVNKYLAGAILACSPVGIISGLSASAQGPVVIKKQAGEKVVGKKRNSKDKMNSKDARGFSLKGSKKNSSVLNKTKKSVLEGTGTANKNKGDEGVALTKPISKASKEPELMPALGDAMKDMNKIISENGGMEQFLNQAKNAIKMMEGARSNNVLAGKKEALAAKSDKVSLSLFKKEDESSLKAAHTESQKDGVNIEKTGEFIQATGDMDELEKLTFGEGPIWLTITNKGGRVVGQLMVLADPMKKGNIIISGFAKTTDEFKEAVSLLVTKLSGISGVTNVCMWCDNLSTKNYKETVKAAFKEIEKKTRFKKLNEQTGADLEKEYKEMFSKISSMMALMPGGAGSAEEMLKKSPGRVEITFSEK